LSAPPTSESSAEAVLDEPLDPDLDPGRINRWRRAQVKRRLTRGGKARAVPIRHEFFRRVNEPFVVPPEGPGNPPAALLSAYAIRTYLGVLLLSGGYDVVSRTHHDVRIDPAMLHLLCNDPTPRARDRVTEARRSGTRNLELLRKKGLVLLDPPGSSPAGTRPSRAIVVRPLRERLLPTEPVTYTAPHQRYAVEVHDDGSFVSPPHQAAEDLRPLERNEELREEELEIRPEGGYIRLPSELFANGLLQRLNGPALRVLLALRFEQSMQSQFGWADAPLVGWEPMAVRQQRYSRWVDPAEGDEKGHFVGVDWWTDGVRVLRSDNVKIITRRQKIRPRSVNDEFVTPEYGYSLEQRYLSRTAVVDE
jgi:hypothetical protein